MSIARSQNLSEQPTAFAPLAASRARGSGLRIGSKLGFGMVASLLTIGGLAEPASTAEDATTTAVTRLASDLQYLSSDALEGRDVGSEGIALAGEFIAQRFRELGLETQLFDGSPFQEFTIPGPSELGPAERNTLKFEGTDVAEPSLGSDFTALSLGANGVFSGELVFAGYGITAPELGYDDYANLDVAGKVVIVLRKEPQQNQEDSKFDGTRSSQFAYFSSKEANAALHKVAALIMVNDRVTAAGEQGDYLLDVTGAGNALTDAQVPTMYCTRTVVDGLLQIALGKSLDDLEQSIDEQAAPQSQVLTGLVASGETNVQVSQVPVRNVLGVLPGRGELAEEYVVVGAHYDHVGMGGAGSLAPGTVAIHNGADDNASGTTTLLEIARRLSANPAENRRTLVFMAFTAEEKGLLGSKYYVRHPRFPLEKTVAMVNLDMVGRLNENTLTVYGTGTATGFEALLEQHNQDVQLTLDKQPAGFGPSDHSSFYEQDIPVFHFFTGLHNDYHRPSDDFETVNLTGMAKIATLVTGVVSHLSEQAHRPSLVKSSAVAQVGRTLGRRGPRGRAVIGIQLDTSVEFPRVDSVEAAGPAAESGLQAGDVLLQIDDAQLSSIDELRAALGGKRPGQTVEITVRRGEESLKLPVKLGRGQ